MSRYFIQAFCLLIAGVHICHAQNFPAPGTIYSEDNNCPFDSVIASAATGMIIWPVKDDATDPDAMEATRASIAKYLNNASDDNFWNYTSQVDGVLLWYSYLNDAQACDIAGMKGVRVPEARRPST